MNERIINIEKNTMKSLYPLPLETIKIYKGQMFIILIISPLFIFFNYQTNKIQKF